MKNDFQFVLEYQLIPTGRGKNLIMWKGYTYSDMHGTYYCSSKGARAHNCTARIKLNENGVIIPVFAEHTHSPPNYLLTGDGKYVKV